MNTISLAVTKKVASYRTDKPDNREHQIAIKDASPSIRVVLDNASKNNLVASRL